MGRRRLAIAALVVAAYAWWATGLRPFHAAAYAAVGVAGVTTVAVVWVTRRAEPRAPGRAGPNVLPWVILASAAVGLETIGLALGGRSRSVPTISTWVDHLLVTHPGRWVLFLAWVGVGLRPALGRRLRAGRP
ncbi:MAG TPA: hypothetical protein VGS61_01780 [Acidimicrobiales bacterium]|nr:hypothetical protein [Acidimicrobiales bacterium]